MFDLDGAIANWREQLAAGGIRSPEVLDELESHLREDVDGQLHAGSTPEPAFKTALERIGQARSLKSEFAKVAITKELQERVKQITLTLAGIPSLATTMNTLQPHIEPRWATYLKGAAFVVPAIFLWMVSAIFLVPKLKEICKQAGFPFTPSFWDLTHSNFLTISFFAEHGLLIAAGIMFMLILLEWRSSKWPRFRRATVGIGVFLLNFVVLLSFFVLVVTALLAAPALMQQAR